MVVKRPICGDLLLFFFWGCGGVGGGEKGFWKGGGEREEGEKRERGWMRGMGVGGVRVRVRVEN